MSFLVKKSNKINMSYILVIDYLEKCIHTQFEFISLPLTATNPTLPGFYRISPGGQAAYSGSADI